MRLSIALLAAPCFLYALPALATEPQPPGSHPDYGQQQPPPSYYGQPPPSGGYGYGAPPGYYPPPQGAYGPPPGGYVDPPPPPAPPRGPQWNIRWNPVDLINSTVSGEVDYAVVGPLTVGLVPSYIYGKPVFEGSHDYDIAGWSLGADVGLWIDGSPFRGTFLKFRAEHESITYAYTPSNGAEARYSLGLNRIGGMLGSQSVHGKLFTISGGIGVMKDLSYSEADHIVPCSESPAGCVVAQGIGNGWDLIGQLAIGVIF